MRKTIPEVDGVAFYQRITKRGKTNCNNKKWQNNATCHKCGKKGHTIPKFPKININNYYDNQSVDTEKDIRVTQEKENSKKYAQEKAKDKKFVQFINNTDNEISNGDGH